MKPQYSLQFNGMVGMKKRDFNNQILKPAFAAAGQFWHAEILPKHFTNRGETEYGYQKRQWKYIKRKLAFKQHTRPLEYSGDLKRSTKNYRVEATFKGVKVFLPKSQAANYRSSPKAPNMADELRRLSDKDVANLVQIINDHIMAAIESRGGTGTYKAKQFQPTRRQFKRSA